MVYLKVMKMATKKGSTSWYTVLQFLGSLVFLWVLYSWWMGGWTLSSWFGAAGGFWAPLFGAVAVFGAVSLFLVSLMSLLTGSNMAEHSKKLTMWTGIAFFAITVGGPLFIGTLVAFILTYFGVGGELKM
jgi:hypothetical protein